MFGVIITYHLVYLFGSMFYSLGYILFTYVLLFLPHFNRGSSKPRDDAILIHYYPSCVCKGVWFNEHCLNK